MWTQLGGTFRAFSSFLKLLFTTLLCSSITCWKGQGLSVLWWTGRNSITKYIKEKRLLRNALQTSFRTQRLIYFLKAASAKGGHDLSFSNFGQSFGRLTFSLPACVQAFLLVVTSEIHLVLSSWVLSTPFPSSHKHAVSVGPNLHFDHKAINKGERNQKFFKEQVVLSDLRAQAGSWAPCASLVSAVPASGSMSPRLPRVLIAGLQQTQQCALSLASAQLLTQWFN